MNIVHIIGPNSDKVYAAIETGETWNGCAVLAFTEDTLRALIQEGDAIDWDGYGLDIVNDHMVDVADEDTYDQVPTIALTLAGTVQSLYAPQGRAWEILDPEALVHVDHT